VAAPVDLRKGVKRVALKILVALRDLIQRVRCRLALRRSGRRFLQWAARGFRSCQSPAQVVPWFLGTDLHRRTVHWRDGRTDVAVGRDEKDVGVRSLSCGVAGIQVERPSVAVGAGKCHAACRNLILFGGAPLRAALVQEWYT
jgi:hypothetical protein